MSPTPSLDVAALDDDDDTDDAAAAAAPSRPRRAKQSAARSAIIILSARHWLSLCDAPVLEAVGARRPTNCSGRSEGNALLKLQPIGDY